MKNTILIWCGYFYSILGNSHNKVFLQRNKGQLFILLGNSYIIYQVQWPFQLFPSENFSFPMAPTLFTVLHRCPNCCFVLCSWWSQFRGLPRCWPWQPPKAGVYQLALGTDFTALGTALAVVLFAFMKHLPPSFDPQMLPAELNAILPSSKVPQTVSAQVASFHSDIVNSWQKSTWEIPWTEEPGTLTVHGVATESDATKSLPAICAHVSDTHCLGSQSLGSHSGSSWMVLI